jgi:hypothetical protein
MGNLSFVLTSKADSVASSADFQSFRGGRVLIAAAWRDSVSVGQGFADVLTDCGADPGSAAGRLQGIQTGESAYHALDRGAIFFEIRLTTQHQSLDDAVV